MYFIPPVITPVQRVFHTILHTIHKGLLRSLWILTVAGLNHTWSEGNVTVLGTTGVVGCRG